MFGLHLVFTQVNTVYSSSPALYRPSCTSKPAWFRTRLHVSREKRPMYTPSWCFAVTYSGLGETDKAFDWFEKAVDDHDWCPLPAS
jgi:hypothetical protein